MLSTADPSSQSLHVRLVGANQVQQIEYGIFELYVISVDRSELYTLTHADVVSFLNDPTTNLRELHLRRHPQFIGMRITQISVLSQTAVLTSDGHAFLIGPLYSDLPCPPMVIWNVPDDVITSCEMAMDFVLFTTKKGHIYRLMLNEYQLPPRLVYDNPKHLVKRITYCGSHKFLAITRKHVVLLWNAEPTGDYVPSTYPSSPLDLVRTPTPVIMPWPVESAFLHKSTIFVASCRQFSYNAVFAQFLNRAALTTLDPFMVLDDEEMARRTKNLFETKSAEMNGYSTSQMESLRAYGTSSNNTNNSYNAYSHYGASNAYLSSSTSLQISRKLLESNRSAYDAYSGGVDLSASSLLSTSTNTTQSPMNASNSSQLNNRPLILSDGIDDSTHMFSFNKRLQEIYDMPTSTEQLCDVQHIAFCKLQQDFMETALGIVKLIIEEMNLPDEKKTFASLPSAGGVAGGIKYLIDGNVFVKLCVDNNNLYGGNEWSGKVANLEIHGMDAYASCLPRLPAGSKLRVPLLAMVDYVGFRALVSTACPVSKRTIVYGSNDAARTVHNDDPEVEKTMLLCASMLNLAPHRVKNCSSRIASAVDVEVHRGEDGHFYILDTARVFPPVNPGVIKSVPLSKFTTASTIHAKDLSTEQTQSLLKDLDSIPISEGLLFFKRPTDAENIPALDPNAVHTAKLQQDVQRMDQDDAHWLDTSEEGRLVSEDMAISEVSERTQSNFVNPIATALLGRVIRGDAWFLKNAVGQRLFQQFRPEFVHTFSKPLSSDALSGFSVDGSIHDSAVREASVHLEQHYSVQIQNQFRKASPYLLPWLNARLKFDRKSQFNSPIALASLVYSPTTLVKFMHRVGLNVRNIGAIRVHIPIKPFQSVSLIEMVSRTCKTFVKRRLRAAHSLYAHFRASPQRQAPSASCEPSQQQASGSEASSSAPSNQSTTTDTRNNGDHQQHQQQQEKKRPAGGAFDHWDSLTPDEISHFSDKPLEYLLKTMAIQAFGIIFGHSATSTYFWTQVIKVHLLVKFGADCLLACEAERKYNLRADIPMAYLFQTVSRRTGTVWDEETEVEMQTAQWSSTPITLTIGMIIGFSLSTKSIKLASLEETKQAMMERLFADVVDMPTPLPNFVEPGYHSACNEPLTRQFYYEAYQDDYNMASTPTNEDPILNPISSSILDSSPSSSAVEQPCDGLDSYHSKMLKFYEDWSGLLAIGDMPVPVLDEVRLLLCRIRPLLDNKCPRGELDLSYVNDTWDEILEKMKTVPMVNCELLSQLLYARGQYEHLKGDKVVAQQYYIVSLNALGLPSYLGPDLGASVVNPQEPNRDIPYYARVTRRFMVHPFALIIIDKILTLDLELSGTIMHSFPFWALFRLVWTMCPFFGDVSAKRRLFNGHAVPLAFTHSRLWEFTPTMGPLPDSSSYAHVTRSQKAFWPFLAQGIFPLESVESQKWISEVYDLESTCGFEISTKWLYTPLRLFPPLIYPILPTQSFPRTTSSRNENGEPIFEPNAPLVAMFNEMEPRFLVPHEAWQWWGEGGRFESSLYYLSGRIGTRQLTPKFAEERLHWKKANSNEWNPELSVYAYLHDPGSVVLGKYIQYETGLGCDAHSQVSKLHAKFNRLRIALEKESESTLQQGGNVSAALKSDVNAALRNQSLHGGVIQYHLVDVHSGNDFGAWSMGLQSAFGRRSGRPPVVRTQFIDPTYPHPSKRYIVHVRDFPESSHILALPSWFDEANVISLEKYGYLDLDSLLLPGVKYYLQSNILSPFAAISSTGRLILSIYVNRVRYKEEDWASVKALDFAGEAPLWLRFSRHPPVDASKWQHHLPEVSEPSIVCITRSGRLFVWGRNNRGLFGNGREGETTFIPKLISALMSSRIIDADLGVGHIITLNEHGVTNYWGSLLPEKATSPFISSATISALHEEERSKHIGSFMPLEKDLPKWGGMVIQTAVAVGAGAHFVVAVSNFGIPYYYGLSPCYTGIPEQWERIWCPERIQSVACGDWHVVLLSENGNVYAFGDNQHSQCGIALPEVVDGFQRCLAPIQFESYEISGTSSSKMVQVVASGSRSAALSENGQVWLWGGCSQSSPYLLSTQQPIKYMSMNSQAQILLLTEDPKLPSRTLPLVPLHIHLETGRGILEQFEASHAERECEAHRAAEDAAAAKRIGESSSTSPSSSSILQSNHSIHSIQSVGHSSSSSRRVLVQQGVQRSWENASPSTPLFPPDTNARDSTPQSSPRKPLSQNLHYQYQHQQGDNQHMEVSSSSAAPSSSSWSSPKMAGEVIPLPINEQANPVESILPQQQELVRALGREQGKAVFEAITDIVSSAIAPLAQHISALEKRLDQLEILSKQR